jgi:osmoprotectant transport system substrate-binding protein
MRINRRLTLGAALLAVAIVASACGSGGGNGGTSATASGGAEIAAQLTLGGPPECPKRPFCIPGLKRVYGITFGSFKPLDTGGPLTVAALKSGAIDVGLLFSTSSVIAANHWIVLQDDKQLQQADNIAPVIRKDVDNAEITSLLDKVSAALDSETITQLNAKVEIEHQDPADVAKAFLQANKVI